MAQSAFRGKVAWFDAGEATLTVYYPYDAAADRVFDQTGLKRLFVDGSRRSAIFGEKKALLVKILCFLEPIVGSNDLRNRFVPHSFSIQF